MKRMNVVVAAEYFGVSRRTIYNWVDAGLLERDGWALVLVPDAFVPPRTPGATGSHRSERRGTPRVQQIVSALRYGPLTAYQLGERLPGTRRTVSGAIQESRIKGFIHRVAGEWDLTDAGRSSLYGQEEERQQEGVLNSSAFAR